MTTIQKLPENPADPKSVRAVGVVEREIGGYTRQMKAAAWIYCVEYARQGLGLREWYAQLSEHKKETARNMLNDLDLFLIVSTSPEAPNV